MNDAQLLKAACAAVKLNFDKVLDHAITADAVTIIDANFAKYTVNRADLPAEPDTKRKRPAARKK